MSGTSFSGPAWEVARESGGILTLKLEMRMSVPDTYPPEWRSVQVSFDLPPSSGLARELEQALLHYRAELAERVAARKFEPSSKPGG